MRKRTFGSVGKRALVALLVLCMSLMMIPATAFADIGGKTYEVEVNASEGDASHTTGEDVAATYNPAVGVLADNGHTAEVVVGDVTKSSGFQHVVMVEADNGGTADVSMGDVTGRVKWGGNGIDVSAKDGNVNLTAGNVTACKVGLNLDNAPTDTAAGFTGIKQVTVDSITQTEDSRYSDAGINAFSYARGDTNIVWVKGDVNAAGSRGIDAQAVGGSDTSVAVDGTVKANYLGVKAVAGSLGNINGTTVSTGTTTVRVGGVVAEKWDRAVEIDSNTKGSTATFQSDGNVEALDSDSTGIFVRSVGGKSNIVVNGDVSGTQAGLYMYCDEFGSNDVLVTGTISGKNGVDISDDSVENDKLTVWKIEKGNDGQYVSSEWNNVPSEEREVFAKKRINYIVYVEDLEQGGTISALKANGSELDKQHGYNVAREGDKVILKIDLQEGYTIRSAYNGKDDMTELLKDENGSYYVVVPRGGGIYLSVMLDDGRMDYTVVPPLDVLISTIGQEANNGSSAAIAKAPLLTVGGVEINDVKLKMEGQTPNFDVTLSNTNNRDVEFDCTKFKVVNVDNDQEVAFKTEVKKLKANETSVEFKFKADENAMKAGDRAYVFYDNQLLGTYTVA